MCKLGRGCTNAHGDKELAAWNEHLEKMAKEMENRKEAQNKKEDDESSAKMEQSSLIMVIIDLLLIRLEVRNNNSKLIFVWLR